MRKFSVQRMDVKRRVSPREKKLITENLLVNKVQHTEETKTMSLKLKNLDMRSNLKCVGGSELELKRI